MIEGNSSIPLDLVSLSFRLTSQSSTGGGNYICGQFKCESGIPHESIFVELNA
jgi:hypothetical protein